MPATHSGASNRFIDIAWRHSNSQNGPVKFLWLSRWGRITSKNGQPRCHCQTRFGTNKAAEIATPGQSCHHDRMRRAGVASTPTPSATNQTAIPHLASMATKTPVQIRSDRRFRKISRVSRKAAPVQAIGSNVEVVRCEVSPAMPGAMLAAIAANAAALAPPPSKRAKLAARNTNPTAAIVAGSRSIQMLTPKTCVAAAISGTSGG
jgi:hypothetical protein